MSLARAILGPDPMVTFLLARIREDEEDAAVADITAAPWTQKAAIVSGRHRGSSPGPEVVASCNNYASARHVARHDPTRVLSDVDVRRRIVAGYELAVDKAGERPSMGRVAALETLTLVVRLLALPYASHPDYRDEWKP